MIGFGQMGQSVALQAAKTAWDEAIGLGEEHGYRNAQATVLAPTGTIVAPTPSVSVTPRVSTLVIPSPSPSLSSTPRVSVAPTHTTTPSPTPTPTPTASPSSAPSPSDTPVPSQVPSATPTPAPVGTSHVVINEIAWAGTASSSSDEWIELYNSGDAPADLTGWALFEGETRIIWLAGSIGPGAYYLVERTDDSTVSDIVADAVGPFGGSGLRNLPGGEDLSLRDAGGVTVDSVPCSGGWFAGTASPDYASMERVDASLPGSEASNWTSNNGSITTGLDAAGNPIRGTPKFKNSVSQ